MWQPLLAAAKLPYRNAPQLRDLDPRGRRRPPVGQGSARAREHRGDRGDPTVTSSESVTSAGWTSIQCWGSVQARPPASTVRTPGAQLRVNDAISLARILVVEGKEFEAPESPNSANLAPPPPHQEALSGIPRPPASTPPHTTPSPVRPPSASATRPAESARAEARGEARPTDYESRSGATEPRSSGANRAIRRRSPMTTGPASPR